MTDSQQHFLELFLRHQAGLFAFIVANGVPPVDADDVLQNAAVVIWEKFADYQPGSSFRAWAFAVTRLEIRKQGDRWRRDSRVLRLGDAALDRLVDQAETGAEAGDEMAAAQQARLSHCLERLGRQARQLLAWYYGDGLGHAAICKRLRISHGALRTRLCRIRKGLQTCLERDPQGEMTP